MSSARRALVVRAPLRTVSDDDVRRSLFELKQLLTGLGIEVEHEFVQRREHPSSSTYVGEGKLRELAALTGGPGHVPRGPGHEPPPDRSAELAVVVDDELSPGQQRNLERALACEVLDRTAVVLRVFESRARTVRARLEIELARLEYELPRIRDDHSLGDREGGGGRAARGHTNVELAKQRIRARIAAIRRELDTLARSEQSERAKRSEVFRIALVGYTNAGKSSLMRQLTGADVLVQDRLFATLGITVRQLAPPAKPPVVVADTVGFMERLPHVLVASFQSTLAEATEAWLLLHVADASDPSFRRQLEVTAQALAEVGAADVPSILLLNKADRLDPAARDALAAEFPAAVVMSALDARDGKRLRARIDAFFAEQLSEKTLVVPYAQTKILAAFRDQLQVLDEQYAEAITVRLRGSAATIAALEAKLGAR